MLGVRIRARVKSESNKAAAMALLQLFLQSVVFLEDYINDCLTKS